MANAGPMGSYNYTHIAAAATAVIRTGPGILRSITVNDATTNSTVTVYDNTAGTGTVIAAIDAGTFIGTLQYDVAFATGLTIVMAAANSDITVAWTSL